MNFQLKHRGVEIPDGLKVAIAQKVSRFDRILPETAFMEIELLASTAHHPGKKEAEVLVDIPGQKQVVRFLAAGETYLAAVDTVLDKLDEEVSTIVERKSDYHYKGKSPKEWLADTMNRDEK